MGWRERLQREFWETDREFVENVLPLGTVDSSSFGLIAEAVRYVLVAEGDEVHIRPDTGALEEALASLARGGVHVARKDAEAAVLRFAEIWEGKARARGKWEEVVTAARAGGEVLTKLPVAPKRRSLWSWLFGR